MAKPVLLDTVEACQEAVARMFQEAELAIDIEGVDLGRQGELCLIQMCGANDPAVYLFDIHVLGESAFAAGGLRSLLEAEHVIKVFYDVRSDNDALHHLHNVKVRGAYDVQVLWHVCFQHPDDNYLQGLKKVQGKFLEQSKILTPRSIKEIDCLKEEGVSLFAPELGGSYEVWKERPLCPKLLQYSAADVKFLLDMRSFWGAKGADLSPVLDKIVKETSTTRLQKFVQLTDAEATNHSSKKFRDFEIPDGFNDTGAISQKVPVPPTKRGLVIGKRGATRQAIESSTGARITLSDSNSYALVIGEPAQVKAAVRQIEAKIS